MPRALPLPASNPVTFPSASRRNTTELPALDTQVVERLELLAEIPTHVARQVHRRLLGDTFARVIPVLMKGDSLDRAVRGRVERDPRRRADHLERRHGRRPERQCWLARKLESELTLLQFHIQQQPTERCHLILA